MTRAVAPALALAAVARPGGGRRQRGLAAAALAAIWTRSYLGYRAEGIATTQREWELLRTATAESFRRHYNECVPTVEEELDVWGAYHAHRHALRYDLVAAAARRHIPTGGRLLDVGCGSAMVADRLADLGVSYVGLEYGGHQLEFAVKKSAQLDTMAIHEFFVQADGEKLPFADGSFDVVVLSEVIEHLLRPELAVWEIARVLRPGGVLVMTTNNASEMPLVSPLRNPLAWLEKAVGFHHYELISHRPWVWPEPLARAILPDGSADVYVPHTWHKQAETRRLFAVAGLDTIEAGSFEFPPPQSGPARWLSRQGRPGEQAADVVEAICSRLPLIDRLGCHVFMVARKDGAGTPTPPPGVWPGPFSLR